MVDIPLARAEAESSKSRFLSLRNQAAAARYPEREPLTVSARHLHGEPIPYEAAIAGQFESFAVGQSWGPAWDTSWFRIKGSVPPRWAGRAVGVIVDLGYREHPLFDELGAAGYDAEALVWECGEPLAGFTGRHREIRITNCATGGEELAWYLEAAANPLLTLEGGFLTGGHFPAWRAVDVGGQPLFILKRADLVSVDLAAEARWVDIGVALELVDSLAFDDPRRLELVEALDALERDGDDAALKSALARPARSSGAVGACGHAHIDTAWVWPMREAKRKVARSWASAARLAREYPDYRFCASSAQHWAWMEQEYPSLFAELRERVAAGQIEPVGAMWVEPDCNLPSGESLARQIIHGWRWFRDHLGIESRGLFLPDVFGFSAQLPQLARLAGLEWFTSIKMSWNDLNRFPYNTFWWEGLDGSRLFTHFPPSDTLSATLAARQLLVGQQVDKGPPILSLALFGYGDGGGGPTRELLQRARRVADLEGLPRVRMQTLDEFFADAQAAADVDGDQVPVWSGELYLETHRGCYTTHADAKRGNRRAQESLREVELWWALRAADRGFLSWPQAALDEAWTTMLALQQHDILPGTSISWVYDDAMRAYAQIDGITRSLIDEALTGDEAVVVNTTGRWREEAVDGRFVTVPPLSATPLKDAITPAPGAVEVGANRVENGIIRVEWDPDSGVLTSVQDLTVQREILAGPGNVLQLLEDRTPHKDAWIIEARALATVADWLAADSVAPTTDGVVVERTSPSGRSRIRQCLRLRPASRRIDIECDVDWHEERTMLKVAFPVDIRSRRATFEVPYGAIERPTHRNTSWEAAQFEVPAQRWADISDGSYGVALLNDSKHGYDVLANVLRLSLLRSTTEPDPIADRGKHRFVYSLFPHPGSWQQGGVVEAAEDLNRPLRILSDGRSIPSLLCLEPAGPVLECVKRADDTDDWIVRMFEPRGGLWTGGLHCRLPVDRVDRVDLLERVIGAEELVDQRIPLRLKPFEVVTLRLSKTDGRS
jgi:alpha-mannosidase